MSFSFQRVVSRLVLLSFLFQTLWPSWALAADVEVLRAPPSPSSSLGFRIGSVGGTDSPRLSLEVFSEGEDDDSGTDSPSPRSLFQKTFQPSDATETVMPLLDAMAIYGQLQVKAEGIEWFAQGLWMTINWEGELLVRGDTERGGEGSAAACSVTPPSKPITLQNPHKVFLGEGLALDHLRVISPLVSNIGQDNRIGLLEVMGLPSSSEETEGGSRSRWSSSSEEDDDDLTECPRSAPIALFQNAPGASLSVKCRSPWYMTP